MMIRTASGRLALIAGFAVTSAAFAGDVRVFNLSDHPDGNAAPPTYGLRLDGFNGGATTSFTFDQFSNMTLTVTDDGSNITIDIEGTLFGGEHDGMGGYVGGGAAYDIAFSYVSGVETSGDGWRVVGADLVQNTGTLTLQGSNDPLDVLTITDNDNNAFIFRPDGHRLDGDNTSWVGRGWLTTFANGDNSPGTQDWLFVGDEDIVPSPGSMALLGLGSLVAARRRRA